MSQSRSKCEQQIIALLKSKGPMSVRDMRQFIPFPYKTIYTKVLELEKNGLVQRYKDDMWILKHGAQPTNYSSQETTALQNSGEVVEKRSQDDESSYVLDPKGMFVETMKAIGVLPVEAIPTIADIFFCGDIDDIGWLHRVLSKDAAGFVMPHQRRLMIAWWARTRGLKYDEADLEDEATEHDDQVKQETEESSRVHLLDLGFGWRLGKNKRGNWVPLPGGPLKYEEALRYAQERQLIKDHMRQYRVR